MHPDHAGGAVLLRDKFGIPLAGHQELDRWYAGPGGWMQKVIDCLLMQSVAWRTRQQLEKGFFCSRIQPDFLLKDGDALPFFPDWQAVAVPGHTSHDLVLYHADQSLLYVADCFLEVKGRYQTHAAGHVSPMAGGFLSKNGRPASIQPLNCPRRSPP
jgi:glyoxylase-like metal-dependent hydrolase (beta-lactamase superfamily II)